ncbi:MAG: serine/threonine protein kinase [Mesorhizobium sp.]|uniref:serine/threonine-protein kinase n=3 Tax=Mesorhizobium sp. TaxID=1871066 RepID=UPI000FE700C2|nr:serine/threonine-protein kinase [Mesorhizobium sp.]RWE12016.1 MAG: serine/threonine protein kinase [Mesorhizobium sp.]RWE63312.1 MAG: serine/threonine protein kinase [Mesorhizobium sp.]TIS67835.1 MAG: serine/threonine protein kinase [Mesorhizobium sp.]
MSADDKTRISPNVANTAVGTQLSGIYELDERIAFGGMGEVYRGHNIQTGDHVAIKIVLPEFARDQTILSLFRKEASILNHLSHDAVVRYHVFTIDPGIGRPYLAMEFVDGQSLFDIMRRGPMPTEDVRKLCHRLASGLSAVHQAGAIHRDLSPDNIILPGGRVERAKIVDFGIARSATVGGETLIGGKFAGKYNYVSPEQLGLYSGDVSEQSDIYSLGLVLAAALRGKPIDMGGSQLEIVEKRRTVPDLSDIDADFRGIVEAMLQPDPQDRPISMADIARATRDDTDEETTPPTSITPRDRAGLPRAGGTAAPGPKLPRQPPAAPGEQRFVPHVRPALLSEPRPSAVAGPARAVLPNAPGKSAKTRSIAIAALASLAVASGAGIYLSGLMTPSTPTVGDTSFLSPKASKPVQTDSAPNSPGDEPAKAVPPQPADVLSPTEEALEPSASAETSELAAAEAQPPAENRADVAADQRLEPTRPAEVLSPTEETPEPAPAETLSRAENQAGAAADQKLEPARPAEVLSPTEETPGPSIAEVPSPAEDRADAAADQKLEPTRPAEVLSPSEETPEPVPPRVQVAPMPPADKAPPPPAVQPDVMESPKLDQSASQQAARVPEPAADQTDDMNAKGQQDEPAAGKQPGEAAVALNVPKPELEQPPKNALDYPAQRASWVRDFNGGDCFYATLTSATETAVEIEGLGTEVQPFERMLSDFQARFHVEPDISVRLIEPAQCEVTNFLRFLDQMATDKPQLVLDRTTVPSGSPIGGTLVTRGGLISSVLLIDHRGMAFNLDSRILAQADKATFKFPIDLGAADKAAGKVVPQIIMVITGPQDVQAAAFSTPTPAALLLPKILEEIATTRSEFSATAKYFRLGG